MAAKLGRAPQLLFRARFDLTNTLAREVQAIANLLQRPWLVVSQAEPETHDLALLAIELEQGAGELVEIALVDHLVVHANLLDDEGVGELARLTVVTGGPNRIVQRDVGSAIVQRREQLGWKGERARLVRQRVHHRLPDPPHRVADELHVARRIEPARGFDETQISFVDEVEERDAQTAIAFGVADHEAEVRFDQPQQRRVIAIALNACAEIALLVDRESRQLGDFAKVSPQRARVAVALGMPLRHVKSIHEASGARAPTKS